MRLCYKQLIVFIRVLVHTDTDVDTRTPQPTRRYRERINSLKRTRHLLCKTRIEEDRFKRSLHSSVYELLKIDWLKKSCTDWPKLFQQKLWFVEFFWTNMGRKYAYWHTCIFDSMCSTLRAIRRWACVCVVTIHAHTLTWKFASPEIRLAWKFNRKSYIFVYMITCMHAPLSVQCTVQHIDNYMYQTNLHSLAGDEYARTFLFCMHIIVCWSLGNIIICTHISK